jgi:hypothetical protein
LKGIKTVSKKEQFVTLVQTAAIVESLTRKDWPSNQPKLSITAAIAVSAAMEVPEAQIPDDLMGACEALIAHVYDNATPKPVWLIGII